MNEKQAKRLRKAIYDGQSSAARGTQYVVIDGSIRTVGKRSLYQAIKRQTGMAVDYASGPALPADDVGSGAPEIPEE